MFKALILIFKQLTLSQKIKYFAIIAISIFISFYLFSFFFSIFLAIFTFIFTRKMLNKFFKHKVKNSQRNLDNIIYRDGEKIQLKEINPIKKGKGKKKK